MERKLLLTKEAARILRISEEYLRTLIRNKEIGAYKEGRRGGYRIPSEEIDLYIARRAGSARPAVGGHEGRRYDE